MTPAVYDDSYYTSQPKRKRQSNAAQRRTEKRAGFRKNRSVEGKGRSQMYISGEGL